MSFGRCLRLANRQHWRCALCGKKMEEQVPRDHPLAATLDHRLPYSRGGRNTCHGGTPNLRALHRSCNILLSFANHCAGALACARVVAPPGAEHDTLKAWGLDPYYKPKHKQMPPAPVDARHPHCPYLPAGSTDDHQEIADRSR